MAGYTFHLIPHTHWDREWYLPQSSFLPRLVAALDDLLDRLRSEPDSTFLLDGQTVLLEDYLRVRSDREAELSELVRAGRLQIGPWYVLADELIPSGESLLRNLLLGRADAARLGARTDVLYSPDAFGHPAVWPQLAGEFGIRFGVVWRGLGGEPGQECDLYRWRSPDEKEVLLYHLPPDGYEIGAALPAEPERLARTWSRVRSGLVERAATRQVAVFVGADHHAAHPALSDLRAHLARLEAGNDVRISRLYDFFVAASAEATGAPVITGELRWSYGYTWTLQGVHSTRAPLKRRHARAELALAGIADPLAALSLVLTARDQRPLLNYAWRLLLQSQFHDSIGGCTSDAVAKQVDARLDDARSVSSEIARTSLDALVRNDPDRVRAEPESGEPQLVLWNPVPRRRRAVAVADLSWFRRDVLVGPPGERTPRVGPGGRPCHLIAASGDVVPLQLLDRGSGQERLDAPHHYPDQDEVDWTRVAFTTPELTGFGLTSLSVGAGARSPSAAVWLEGRRMGNELMEVSVAPGGSIELTDRRTRQRYSDLIGFESGGDEGDTYSYAPPSRDRLHRTRGARGVRVLARGPLVAALEVRWSLPAGRRRQSSRSGVVDLRLTLSLHAGSPALRCSLLIENRAEDHRLRMRVPTRLPGGVSLAGGQFGTQARAGLAAGGRRYPRETPVATAPAHRYVGRAVKSRGLALLAPGFFEYELTAGGELMMTLLRAVGQLSRSDLPTRPGHAGWPVATPLAQCPGPERLHFALAPVSQGQLEGGTVLPELWEDLFLPIQPVFLRQASPLTVPAFEVRLEGAGLVFSALKPAETGEALALRCFNATPKPAAGTWHLSSPVAGAQRARADEQGLHEIRLGEGGRSIPFHAAPREIVTIMVTLASSH
jgi:alpha-mannosidase